MYVDRLKKLLTLGHETSKMTSTHKVSAWHQANYATRVAGTTTTTKKKSQ